MEKHTSVLLDEALDALAIKRDGIYVDATVGSHGHGEAILARLGKDGTYIGIDADPHAIREAEAALLGSATVRLCVGNFRAIDSIVETQGISQVDGILADLGWRMEQFSGNGKGFSFTVDEPLIMTYGDTTQYQFTAYDIVNSWDEDQIVTILSGYGEERFARRIARAVITARKKAPIASTQALVDVIRSSVPSQYRYGKIHPATRTFQALRMTVNDELSALEEFLTKALTLLKPGGRLAVITFHSLEDRIVKHTFRKFEHDLQGVCVTKKPISPTREEIQRNRRARSAHLRTFEKYEYTHTYRIVRKGA